MRLPTIDCGVIIALREEFEGQDTFGGFGQFFELEQLRKPGLFQPFHFTDSQGLPRTGIVAVMESMTPLSAYETTRELLDTYAPTLLVNIGIAGALSTDLRLGDVIVADEVDSYDYRAKAVPSKTGSLEDFTFVWGGRHSNPSEDVAKLLGQSWKLLVSSRWEQDCAKRLNKGIATKTIQQLSVAGLIRDKQHIKKGSIASGNIIGASDGFRKALLESRDRTLLAIEMESFGFLRAAARNGCKSLVLKAISDLADENKEELDRSTGDSMRAWAASNAFQLLGIACREVFTFSAWGEARAVLSQSTDLDTTNAERKGLLEFALRHFKKQHKRLVEDIDGSLTLYDPLFRCIMGTYPISDSNIFDTIAGQIIASPDHYPLRVNGKPGVGKTTFLTLLYLALYKLSTQRVDAPIPAYVNLKRYVNPERGKEHGWSSQAAADNDFAFLRKLLSPESSQNVIILLDGIDEYDRYDTAIETQLLDLIEQCSNAKKIVGVGLNYLPNRERFKRGLRRGLDNPTRQVTLEGLDVTESEKIAAFVKAFEPTYPHSKGGFDYHQEVIRRVKSFSLKSIDLLVISMLFDLIRDKARYEQADTLSAFFQIYCESFLQTEAGTETLDEAARLAFEYTVRPGALGSMDEYLHKRSWKLLHLHPNIRDFLVAWHAVQLVRSAANSSDGAKNADLNYVYPHNVNRFCKDIVNSNRDVQFDVLEGSKRIYRDGGENAKPHAVYLVGRFNDEGALGAARSWLRNLCIPEVVQIQERNDSELSFSDLLLCRTVYISLAVMNDSSASEAYIQILLDRPQWNDINRGFHLEYYGDIPFDPERQLSHSDILAPFPRTYHNLRERIESNLGNRKYGLFNIEVFTLYSLAQYRHSEGRLDDEVRQNLAEFIVEILKSKILSESVRNYLKMLQINFNEGPRFLPGRVADKLFMFKTQIRAGWVDRKLPLKRVESVADHTMGALILGLTYLPEGNPKHWPDYDKFQVLQYIMIHDLGESIAGDVAIHNPDAVHAKIREREAYCYLNMVRTYPAIADFSVYFKLWNRFEAGADENAKIARDIDKLENLVQLYIYSREVVVSDYAKWKEDLVCDIGTEAGKGILKIVQDYFEN